MGCLVIKMTSNTTITSRMAVLNPSESMLQMIRVSLVGA